MLHFFIVRSAYGFVRVLDAKYVSIPQRIPELEGASSLTACLPFASLGTCSYVRVQQTGDPSYSTYDDLSSYTGVKVTGTSRG